MVSRSEAAVPVLEETFRGEGELATVEEDLPHPIKELQLAESSRNGGKDVAQGGMDSPWIDSLHALDVLEISGC